MVDGSAPTERHMAEQQQSLSVFYGEPGFWSGRHGTTPNPAPVYGKVKGRNGEVLDLGQEVLIVRPMSRVAERALIVGIGDEGLPDQHVVKVRPHKSAYVVSATPAHCEPHLFDEYEWLNAETQAATDLTKSNIDLGRAIFGGFYFRHFQDCAMKHYLANRAALATTQAAK